MIATLAGALLATTTPLQAQPQAQPQVTAASKDFGAWQARCETRTAGATSQRACGLVSSVTVKGPDGKPAVATVIMLRPTAAAGQYQLSIELPLSVWLPSGVTLRDAGQHELIKLPFVTCHPQGCEAGSVIDAGQVGRLAAAGDAASATYELQARKTVTLSFSMKGFAAALSALQSGKIAAGS